MDKSSHTPSPSKKRKSQSSKNAKKQHLEFRSETADFCKLSHNVTTMRDININLNSKSDPRLDYAIHLQRLITNPLKPDGALARIRDIVNASNVSALEILSRGIVQGFLRYLTEEGEYRNDRLRLFLTVNIFYKKCNNS
jgi:hypothetical protein